MLFTPAPSGDYINKASLSRLFSFMSRVFDSLSIHFSKLVASCTTCMGPWSTGLQILLGQVQVPVHPPLINGNMDPVQVPALGAQPVHESQIQVRGLVDGVQQVGGHAQGARPPAPGGDACARQYACRSKTACDKRLCAVCCVPLIHMVHNNNTSSFLGALRCARILRASGASRMRRWKRESHVYTPPSHVSWSGAVGAETTWMEADMQVLVCGTAETVERLMLVSRQVGANSCSRLP